MEVDDNNAKANSRNKMEDMDTTATAAAPGAAAATAAAGSTTPDAAATVATMLEACRTNDAETVRRLVSEDATNACRQDHATGTSPLMVAAATGNVPLVHRLLDAGAPWNAVDRRGQCAGNYATDAQHWDVVNLLVDWGVRAELILGMIERSQLQQQPSASAPNTAPSSENGSASSAATAAASACPVEHLPSTKHDYLRQRLQYTDDGNALLDADRDAVMMEWERPLMKAHAQILMEGTGRRVMNVGFGMGIIDTALQELQPVHQIIIEAHPDVYKRMLDGGWDRKPNVRLCFGRWQDVVPQLIREGVVVDAIFYDTVRFGS